MGEEKEEAVIPEEPVDLGVPTAFCIQLFCIDERYEMRSIDFMAEVFKRFPVKTLTVRLSYLPCAVKLLFGCRSLD